MRSELIYRLALELTPNLGPISARRILEHYGNAEEIFEQDAVSLQKIFGIGDIRARSIGQGEMIPVAEAEMEWAEENEVDIITIDDDKFPERLKQCADAPLLLFTKGNVSFNKERVVCIVGSRKATEYGRDLCKKLVRDLAPYDVEIISGLAYGIDIVAHREAIQNEMPTVAVLGHGLDRIYPFHHTPEASELQKNGALVSEFCHGTIPDRENFPRRNRIVAGMSDAVVVVESDETGGSMITASMGNSYSRDVFAFPGPVGAPMSRGCHALIKRNQAALIETAEDIARLLGWKTEESKQAQQPKLFLDLIPEQQTIFDILSEKGEVQIDDLSLAAEMPVSKLSAHLLDLELNGIVSSAPGKIYKLSGRN